MEILVVGKTPTRCADCKFYNTDDYAQDCLLYSQGIPARYGLDGYSKPDWCELKEDNKSALEDIKSAIANHKLTDDEKSDMDEDSIKWGMKIAYDIVDSRISGEEQKC